MMDPLDVEVAELERLAADRRSRLGALSRSATLDRIAATTIEWRIDGVLSSVDYGTLAGPKGAGKSFGLADMGVSVGLGEPWFGCFPTRQNPGAPADV